MTADQVDDAWMETCLISISKIGGTELAAHGVTETVDLPFAEKDIEGIPIVNGGRITKWNPEGDSEITLEAYPLQVGTDTGSTLQGFEDLMHSVDANVPIRVINNRNRDKYRIVVMWTNDSTAATAVSVTAENASALRAGLADAHITSVKKSFTDGILKYTIKIKCAAFDKAGEGNVLSESAAGFSATDILPAIAAYTTSNKWS